MVMLLLFVLAQPQPPEVELTGWAKYYAPSLMERVAAYRGYAGRREPVALMDCDHLGTDVWVHLGGQWMAAHVVDCAQAEHLQRRLGQGDVVEVSWSLWHRLSLPLAPVWATVSFALPWADRVRRFGQNWSVPAISKPQ